MKIIKNKFLLFSFLAFLFVPSAVKAKLIAQQEGWHGYFAPYLWLSAVDGDLTVDGHSRHFHIPFSQILKDFEGGFQGHAEVGYGPLSLMIDPTYLRLSDDFNRNVIQGHIKSDVTLIDGGVFYQLFAHSLPYDQTIAVEVLGGARYLDIDNKINLGAEGFNVTVKNNIDVTAPIVGARIKYDYTPDIHLWLRGDVGGFGVDSVHNTWSTAATLSYSLTDDIAVGLAYRVLRIDIDKKPNTAVDNILHGPMIGMAFSF